MAFSDQLKEQCADLAEKYNYKRSETGRGFEALAVHLSAADGGFTDLLAGKSVMEADLSDAIFRQNEGGCDGILEDEDNRLVMVIQAKYLSSGSPDEDSVKALFDLPATLRGDPTAYLAHLDPRAADAIAGVIERVADNWTLVLRFVTNRPVSERLVALAEARETKLQGEGQSVRYEVVGQEELKSIWEEALSQGGKALKSVEFKVRSGYKVTFDQPTPTLVAVMRGTELKSLFKQHRNYLFAENIRLPMLSSTRINPDLKKTASETPGDFFYFNNGVSAVCKSFAVDGNVVTAEEFQVINGAQTVGTLGNIASLSSDVQVLFRLAATDDPLFRDEITRTNNTQNEVVPWDFRSNDSVQKSLEVTLKEYSGKGPLPTFWYRRKRGQIAAGKGGRALEPEYLGKLRHAWVKGPIPSYKAPKDLASVDSQHGRYYEAFGSEGASVVRLKKSEVEEAMVAYALDLLLIARADRYRKQSPPHAYGTWLKRLSRYVVGAFAEVSRRLDQPQLAPAKLVKLDATEFEKAVEPVLKEVLRETNSRYNALKGARVQPEYDIARDQKGFDDLCASVEAVMTA